jgi:hypothetical protein
MTSPVDPEFREECIDTDLELERLDEDRSDIT